MTSKIRDGGAENRSTDESQWISLEPADHELSLVSVKLDRGVKASYILPSSYGNEAPKWSPTKPSIESCKQNQHSCRDTSSLY